VSKLVPTIFKTMLLGKRIKVFRVMAQRNLIPTKL